MRYENYAKYCSSFFCIYANFYAKSASNLENLSIILALNAARDCFFFPLHSFAKFCSGQKSSDSSIGKVHTLHNFLSLRLIQLSHGATQLEPLS